MMEKKDRIHILLCGYYFQANTGDDLLQESITEVLSRHGEVRVTSTESFDAGMIDWCDLLVVGAGSLMTSRGIGGYAHAKYAKEHGKKVVFYSQTIEDGHPLFEEHLSRADLITVRDSQSKKVVETHGMRAVVAGDPIFVKKRRTIGISMRSWVNQPSDVVEKLAAVFDNLAADYDLIFMAYTEADTDTESDARFHDRILQTMKSQSRQGSYADNIAHVDLLIGMRLHALITAVNMGKQVLAIEYDTKVGRIFSDLGLQGRVVSYGEADRMVSIVREKIFASDRLAAREKVNEALIAVMCAELRGDEKPAVSVVMPTYNRSALLRDAMDSLIGQTLADWELVLIDDGSTDDTESLVRSYQDARIRYYQFGHNGISYSRNIGSLLSRADIIAVADSDDINLPDRLDVSRKTITENKADVIYSSMYHYYADGRRELVPSQPFSLERLHQSNFIYHPTVAYRRDVALSCPYSEDLEMVEDYHMYQQAAGKGFVFFQIEEPLVLHRIHEGQISSERSEEMAKIHEELVQSGSAAVKKQEDSYSPLVSVIVPTFNRPEMLKTALGSILAQTYRNFEIMVVNDAGEDVADVVESFHDDRIVYLSHQENKGLPAARNTGLRAARGEYIAYLDDDDIFYADHLEVLVDYLKKGPLKVAYTDSYHVRQSLFQGAYVPVSKQVKFSRDFDRDQLLISNCIPVINVMHEKDLLESSGVFDESLDAHEDWDLWIRLSRLTDFHHIKKVTAEVSERNDGTTMTSSDRLPYLRTMKLIHERYAPLVKNSAIKLSQKQAQESIASEIPDKIGLQVQNGGRKLGEKSGQERKPETTTECMVSVIVVNYNGKDYLEPCLNSLMQVARGCFSLEIIMVDNLSVDGSVDYVRDTFPGIMVVENDVNNFARALNLGIDHAKGDYIAFLNNDTVVDKNWLRGLLDVIEGDENIGAVQSKILFSDGKTINSVGVEEEAHFYFKDTGFNEEDRGQYQQAREIACYTGGSVLFRRTCMEQIGRIDEDFILFYEDVDYSIRCKKAGWKIYYAPESIVFHKYHGMASMELASYFSSRNRLLCLAKHDPHQLADSIKTSKFYLNDQMENLYQSLIQAARKLINAHPSDTALKVLADLKNTMVGIYGHQQTEFFFSQVEVLMGVKKIKMGICENIVQFPDGDKTEEKDGKPPLISGDISTTLHTAAGIDRPVLAVFNRADKIISRLQESERKRKEGILEITEQNRVLAEKDRQIAGLTEWAVTAESYAKSLEQSSSSLAAEREDMSRQVQSLTEWVANTEAYARSLEQSLAADREEASRQVQSLTEWATGAETYAKSLESQVEDLRKACSVYEAEIETLKEQLLRIQSHWLYKLANIFKRSRD